MFKRWLVVLAILLSANAQAYQQGEELSPLARQKLALDPGALTIIDFFAEWCVSCRAELPEVNQLARDLDGERITVLGVDVDEDVELAKAFQQELGLTFPIINDPDQMLVEDFQPIGMPALYYVYQGKVVKVRNGAINHIREVILTDLKTMGLVK